MFSLSSPTDHWPHMAPGLKLVQQVREQPRPERDFEFCSPTLDTSANLSPPASLAVSPVLTTPRSKASKAEVPSMPRNEARSRACFLFNSQTWMVTAFFLFLPIIGHKSLINREIRIFRKKGEKHEKMEGRDNHWHGNVPYGRCSVRRKWGGDSRWPPLFGHSPGKIIF